MGKASHPLLRLVVVLAVLVFAAAGCSRSPKIRRLAADAVVVAFGDSLTSGHGAEEGQDFPTVLAKLSGWQVINAGIPGEMSGVGLGRLPSVLAEHRPALVILCHGGNDILTGAPPASIAANLDAMIRHCREAGADVLLVAVPQKGFVLKPAAFYAEVAKRNGIPCNERIIANVLSKPPLKSDYVHPNAKGYALIAETLLGDLRRAQSR